MVRTGTANVARRRSARGGSARSQAAPRPGAQLFDPTQVARIQRARILAAMLDVSTEQGAANVSVADVVSRSGVSRRTFYEAFTDREDCFLAAFDDALAMASERVLFAYQVEGKWRERIRAGLVALLSFLDEEPAAGRLLIVESLSGGPRMLERRERVLALVAGAIDEGRTVRGTHHGRPHPEGHRQAGAQSANGASLPPLTGESLVGGALAVIGARLARAQREPLIGLANQLMSMIVLPYRGASVARRELERHVPVPNGHSERPVLLADPFKEVGMRLTYRTVRVLLAVAEHPGASNRQVGDSAGISDQGQISKLLGRLQRLGLISNTSVGPGQGAPNVWTLTSRGGQFAESIRVHTQHTNDGEVE